VTNRSCRRRPEAFRFPVAVVSIALVATLAISRDAFANGGDLPAEIALKGFAKIENGRIRLVIRTPLLLLASFSLPKRGPGYLDLARIDDALARAADATGRQIAFSEDDVQLVPTVRASRISLLSDRSFSSYAAALAHVEGPALPVETDLFWNQGFFDTELEYPVRSAGSAFSVRVNIAPELGRRVKLWLGFLPADGEIRIFELPGGSDWVPLEPRWHHVAWRFVKSGFVDTFAIERLVFLLCLIAPFRRFDSLLAVVMVMTGLQALTLTAFAEGAVVDARWLPPLFDTCVGVAVVLLAIGNLATPNLRRRWFIGAVIGALGGFGLGRMLAGMSQFAGTHTIVSAVSFNAGVALGEVVSLALMLVIVQKMMARMFGLPLTVVILSAVLGHLGWHWMIDGSHELERVGAGLSSSSLATVAAWLSPALLVGGLAWFLPRGFGGAPVLSLLHALFGRRSDENSDPARQA
jgi:hypothetical protein